MQNDSINKHPLINEFIFKNPSQKRIKLNLGLNKSTDRNQENLKKAALKNFDFLQD